MELVSIIIREVLVEIYIETLNKYRVLLTLLLKISNLYHETWILRFPRGLHFDTKV